MADSKYSDPSMPAPADGNMRTANDAMPDRGTSSGMVGMGAPYGASIDMNATNRLGGMGRSTQSDAMDECCPMGGGDFTANDGDHKSPRGTSLGSAADSDPVDDDRPSDQRM